MSLLRLCFLGKPGYGRAQEEQQFSLHVHENGEPRRCLTCMRAMSGEPARRWCRLPYMQMWNNSKAEKSAMQNGSRERLRQHVVNLRCCPQSVLPEEGAEPSQKLGGKDVNCGSPVLTSSGRLPSPSGSQSADLAWACWKPGRILHSSQGVATRLTTAEQFSGDGKFCSRCTNNAFLRRQG